MTYNECNDLNTGDEVILRKTNRRFPDLTPGKSYRVTVGCAGAYIHDNCIMTVYIEEHGHYKHFDFKKKRR